MKVLLGTDGSENADAAVSMLAQLPDADPLEIIVISVLQIPDLHYTLGSTAARESYVIEQNKRFGQAFERVKSLLEGRNVRLDCMIRSGHVGKTILEASEECDVDLIVIGALGQSLIDYVLLGSTSDFVATYAKRSVLVVRPTDKLYPDLRFLVACDGSDASESAYAQLAGSGWAGCSSVDLVHVLPPPVQWMTQEDQAVIRQAASDELEQQLASLRLRDKLPSLDTTTHVVESGHVGKRLVQFAEENATDMVVMGSTGRSLLARFLLGSVSRFVLRHAPCSVWISRDPEGTQ